jgi:hypothetical protein
MPLPTDSHNSFLLLKFSDEIIGFAFFWGKADKMNKIAKIPVNSVFLIASGL